MKNNAWDAADLADLLRMGAGELVKLGGVVEGEVPVGHGVILPRGGETSEGASGSATVDSMV